ncbi:hypothetical protein ACWGNZ_08000 [Sphingomonas zeae]|jgi:hypothetical protein
MTASLTRRLTVLEAKQPRHAGRRLLLMPWDIMPERREGDLIGCYRFVTSTSDGPECINYERNGIHPKDDVPGSLNRYLYFGEPRHA